MCVCWTGCVKGTGTPVMGWGVVWALIAKSPSINNSSALDSKVQFTQSFARGRFLPLLVKARKQALPEIR